MASGRELLSTRLRNLLSLWRLDDREIDGSVLPYRHPRKPRRRHETRRCRRSDAFSVLKRTARALPMVILSTFGALHILQVLIGRSRLFWDADRVEFNKFLPDLDRLHRFDNGLFRSTTDASQDVVPIPCHSHNDYWRREPLFDAISWGCTGVEADVWLFDGELYVGHTISSLKRGGTFREIYVDKLVGLLDRMNAGSEVGGGTGQLNGVFSRKPGQALTLLVDLKNSGRHAFEVLQEQLSPLREKDYITYWNGQEVVPRAVTVVATGDAPFDLVVANATYRDIFFDAPLEELWEKPRSPIDAQDPIHELDSEIDYGSAMSLPNEGQPLRQEASSEIHNQGPEQYNTNTSYYASTSFAKTVGLIWRGHLSPRQMEIIRGQIRGAKRRGLKARYWNTPPWPIALRNHVWHVLVKEGADVLNVDDLAAAARQTWNARVHQLW